MATNNAMSFRIHLTDQMTITSFKIFIKTEERQLHFVSLNIDIIFQLKTVPKNREGIKF